jgi:type IV secretion system protein VirD4
MPMTPPASGPRGAEADVERARWALGVGPEGQAHVSPKKIARVVQAVIAGEQRQMEMDFGGAVADAEAVTAADEAQMRSAVDGLDEIEAMLREGDDEKLVAR